MATKERRAISSGYMLSDISFIVRRYGKRRFYKNVSLPSRVRMVLTLESYLSGHHDRLCLTSVGWTVYAYREGVK